MKQMCGYINASIHSHPLEILFNFTALCFFLPNRVDAIYFIQTTCNIIKVKNYVS